MCGMVLPVTAATLDAVAFSDAAYTLVMFWSSTVPVYLTDTSVY